MVHTKILEQGKSEPLTFSQLKRLEKMDRDKAREQGYIELGKSFFNGAGVAIAGVGNGLGEAMRGYLSGDAPSFVLKSAAGFLFFEWLVKNYPNFARFTHLDSLALNPGLGSGLTGGENPALFGLPLLPPITGANQSAPATLSADSAYGPYNTAADAYKSIEFFTFSFTPPPGYPGPRIIQQPTGWWVVTAPLAYPGGGGGLTQR